MHTCFTHILCTHIHLSFVYCPDQVPAAGCTLKVGNVSSGWQEGAVTIMDDSFEHEVHNHAEQSRLVLLVDALHPDLTAGEIAAMKPPQMGERVIAANLDVPAYSNVARAFGIAQTWTMRDSDRMHASSLSQ